ncbi:MAG: hypothetical protein WCL07_04745 [bacterium]
MSCLENIVKVTAITAALGATIGLAEYAANQKYSPTPEDLCPNPNVLCLTSDDLSLLTISGEPNKIGLTGFKNAFQLGGMDQDQSQTFFQDGLGLDTPFNPFNEENSVPSPFDSDWILRPEQEIKLPVSKDDNGNFTVEIPGKSADLAGYKVDAGSFLGMVDLLKSVEAIDIPQNVVLKGELPDHTKVFVSPNPNEDRTYNTYFSFPLTGKERNPADICDLVDGHPASCPRAAHGDLARDNTIQPEGKSGFVWQFPAILNQSGEIELLRVVDPAYPDIKINIPYDDLKQLIRNAAPQMTNLSVDQGRVILPLSCLGIVAALVLLTPIGLGLKHILFAGSIEEATYGKRVLKYGGMVANSMLQNSAQVVYRLGAGAAGFVGANALIEASRTNSLGYLLPESLDPNIKSIQALITIASLLTIFKRPILKQIAIRMARAEYAMTEETAASELLYGHLETKLGPLFPAAEIFFTTALLGIIPQLINGISAEQLWNNYSNVAQGILGVTGGITALSWGLTLTDMLRVQSNRQ